VNGKEATVRDGISGPRSWRDDCRQGGEPDAWLPFLAKADSGIEQDVRSLLTRL
jgi:hypothetical protein